jgi:hypothetical protein
VRDAEFTPHSENKQWCGQNGTKIKMAFQSKSCLLTLLKLIAERRKFQLNEEKCAVSLNSDKKCNFTCNT